MRVGQMSVGQMARNQICFLNMKQLKKIFLFYFRYVKVNPDQFRPIQTGYNQFKPVQTG
jgi:hypothetical protein